LLRTGRTATRADRSARPRVSGGDVVTPTKPRHHMNVS
jgi:hypothetical protein